jgi:hypothetical protein
MCRKPLSLALLASALAASASPAAPAPRPGPVEFTVTLDRKSYLPLEPILAECALTNVSKQDVLVPADSWIPACFEGTDGKGYKIALGMVGTYCPDRASMPLVRLQPGQSLHNWLQLNADFTPPPRVGRYTLRALRPVGYTYSDREHGEEFEASSEEVSFEVVKPEGGDAEAVKMIEAAVLKRCPPPSDAGPDDIKAALEGRPVGESLRRWAEGYEDACNRRLSFPSDEEVAKQDKSPRFRVAASFWLGVHSYHSGRRSDDSPGVNEDILKEAVQRLTVGRDSDGASPYLKGLARYHLLLCKLEDRSDDARREAKKMAEALIEDCPKTFMADKAQEVLDQLKAASK